MKTMEIEIALMQKANYKANIIVPNVSFGITRRYTENGKVLYDELHECDVLKVTSSGYATEYEIKISKSDFKADSKKKHGHRSHFIKQFYYVVTAEILEFAKANISDDAGLICYDGVLKTHKEANARIGHWQWTDEEMYKLARLGAMRIFKLKSRYLELKRLLK